MRHDLASTMNKDLIFCLGALIRFCFMTLLVLLVSAPVTGGSDRAESASNTDASQLEGRWARSDGGYALELSNIQADGTLSAEYFNPRPIKVFNAAWSIKDGKTILVVELRDVNYPGSTYTLQYDPASDRLRGTYFQAVEKLTYAIEFLRSK